MNVTVYFNEHPDHWEGYVPGHPVRKVFSYDARVAAGNPDAVELADEAYELFNAPPEFLRDDWCREIAARYREGGNRSLSVGDVVHVGDIWLACEFTGWRRLDETPTVRHRLAGRARYRGREAGYNRALYVSQTPGSSVGEPRVPRGLEEVAEIYRAAFVEGVQEFAADASGPGWSEWFAKHQAEMERGSDV